MPYFYLEPRNGDTSDEAWEGTDCQEGCWTKAETEREARITVEFETLKMRSVRMGRAKIFSPWRQTKLTDCRPDTPPKDIPEGVVLTKSGRTYGRAFLGPRNAGL
jgi:hypothetical protein